MQSLLAENFTAPEAAGPETQRNGTPSLLAWGMYERITGSRAEARLIPGRERSTEDEQEKTFLRFKIARGVCKPVLLILQMGL